MPLGVGKHTFSVLDLQGVVDSATLDTIEVVIGIVLLTLSVFLILAINALDEVLTSARHVVTHQLLVMLLISVITVQTGFAATIRGGYDLRVRMLVTAILSFVAEALQQYGFLLFGVFAVGLQDVDSLLYAVICKRSWQAALLFATWVVAGLEVGIIMGLGKSRGRGDNMLSPHIWLIRGVFDGVALLGQFVALVRFVSKAKRGARQVAATELECAAIRVVEAYRMRLAGTLAGLCGLSLVLTAPNVGDLLYRGIRTPLPSGDGHHRQDVVSLVSALLWQLNNLLMTPIFLLRHPGLRFQMRLIVCRKCFKYEKERFHQHIPSHYGRLEACHTMARDPRVAAAVLNDPKKKLSVASMPAVMRTIQNTSDEVVQSSPGGSSCRQQGSAKASTVSTPKLASSTSMF